MKLACNNKYIPITKNLISEYFMYNKPSQRITNHLAIQLCIPADVFEL